jgi:hypothetical protein
MEDFDIDLELAIAIWELGDDIPLDLEVVLLGKGYDVQELRKRYMN